LSRSARLLDLLQALRRRRRPVAGVVLAEELGVSLRTLYRDIATLTAQGAAIEGSAGLGYVLRAETFLPPLMFSEAEADAVLLGLRLVAARGDEDLAEAAEAACSKIEAVLPPGLDGASENGLLAAPVRGKETAMLGVLRAALRAERKLHLEYGDKKGRASRRVVWPVAIGFFASAEVLAAWCELRGDFRHFRLDRIVAAEVQEARIPRHRRVLMAEWRAREDLDI
jgi:predicted DNA-binding transcriptional regulator YafY